ncbi:vacuolar protein sorting protein [Striga asiatica]|uniref:Vacuolar protein sorting protein n=1 Tax=Striga asiatica TaxID=4170 RepID=A0A5A7RIS3_STRAF|nr:vacuolar protein sorting protein [Striga asiatica]
MKSSLILREDPKPPILKTKISLTIISLHFSSAEIAVGNRQKLSINFEVGLGSDPLLKFSYRPNDPRYLFDKSLKTEVGIFGSVTVEFGSVGGGNPNFFFTSSPNHEIFPFGDVSSATLPEKKLSKLGNVFVCMMGFCICPLDKPAPVLELLLPESHQIYIELQRCCWTQAVKTILLEIPSLGKQVSAAAGYSKFVSSEMSKAEALLKGLCLPLSWQIHTVPCCLRVHLLSSKGFWI